MKILFVGGPWDGRFRDLSDPLPDHLELPSGLYRREVVVGRSSDGLSARSVMVHSRVADSDHALRELLVKMFAKGEIAG